MCSCGKLHLCATCLAFGMFMSTICLLLAVGTYLFQFKKYEDVQPGTCTTVTSYFRDDYFPSCSCGDECQVSYPCLIVKVNLDESGPPDQHIYNGNTTETPQLSPSIERIFNHTQFIARQNYNSTNGSLSLFHNERLQSCSINPQCSSIKSEVISQIDEFNQTYGIPGTVFRCLFSPTNTDRVFAHFNDEAGYIQTIVVAVCFLAAFILGFFFAVRHLEVRRQRKKDSRRRQVIATEMQPLQRIPANPRPSQSTAQSLTHSAQRNGHRNPVLQNQPPPALTRHHHQLSGPNQNSTNQYRFPPGAQYSIPSAPDESPPPYELPPGVYLDDPPPYKA